MRRLNPAARPRPTPTRARTRARRDPRNLRRQRLMRWGVAALGAALIAGGLWSFWPSRWVARQQAALGDGLLALSADVGLRLERVMVEGRRETPVEQIVAAVGATKGAALLALDPDAIRARLRALPWVKTASVRRGFDGTLTLSLEEFEPFALWQRDGKFYLVDREGETIAADPGRFDRLLVLVGDNAPQHAADLVAMLGLEPELKARVRAAVWVGDRRWNLRFDNGIDVKLPETDPTSAWLELARMEREQGVLKRDLVSIDLRLPDRAVVRLAPGAAPAAVPAMPTGPGSDT
ncbi:MAG: cell division protein FtsQ/DivIB [Pseudomonadota bacterium]